MLKKGFTLIELIIVIGIIALLATTVILVINPVNIFKEARDSQRIADLGQINSAIGLYLATASDIDLDGSGTNECSGTNADCWVHDGGDIASGCGGRHGTKTAVSSASVAVNGTGWIPVDLTKTSGGSPLAAFPKDPKKSTTLFYSYACDSAATTVELNADMESDRYGGATSADNVEKADGGNSDTLFEVGNAPGLGL